jgi:hypothetical protein
MAIDPTTDIRVGIVTTLRRNGGPGAPVYDRVPDNEPPPAVIVDTVDLDQSATKDGGARVFFFEIVTIVRGRSKVEAEGIMGNVFARLEDMPLSVSGFTVARPKLQSSRLESQGDMLTHVGRQLFRSIIL